MWTSLRIPQICFFLIAITCHSSLGIAEIGDNVGHKIADLIEKINNDVRNSNIRPQTENDWRELNRRYQNELSALEGEFQSALWGLAPGIAALDEQADEDLVGAIIASMFVFAPIKALIGGTIAGFLVWKSSPAGTAFEIANLGGKMFVAVPVGTLTTYIAFVPTIAAVLYGISSTTKVIRSYWQQWFAKGDKGVTVWDRLNSMRKVLKERGIDPTGLYGVHPSLWEDVVLPNIGCPKAFIE